MRPLRRCRYPISATGTAGHARSAYTSKSYTEDYIIWRIAYIVQMNVKHILYFESIIYCYHPLNIHNALLYIVQVRSIAMHCTLSRRAVLRWRRCRAICLQAFGDKPRRATLDARRKEKPCCAWRLFRRNSSAINNPNINWQTVAPMPY